MRRLLTVFCFGLAVFVLGTASAHSTTSPLQSPIATPLPSPMPGRPAIYGYTVVATYPHDRAAFTQGLVYDNGVLYESTGQYGQSSLRKVQLKTGRVLQRRGVSRKYFAEGLVLVGNRLIQLSWKEQTGFVYDKATFRQTRTFTYTTEGWGITFDGTSLIMSDGSANLYFLDPQTFALQDTLAVSDNGQPVTRLNELEFVNGEILANVWQTDRIARINPKTGRVIGWIDLSGLLTPTERQRADVLNGIAYDPKGDRLFVTGKYWPKLFEIKLVPKP
jgi:glutamine cyclotransferase